MIITAPDPRLRLKSRDVDVIDDEVRELAALLHRLCEGIAVGLSAPEIGVLKRVIAIHFDSRVLTLINPELVKASHPHLVYEVCLSLPGLSFYVRRPNIIKVRYQDVSGEWHSEKAHDRLAQGIAHEMDHLDGVMVDTIAERTLGVLKSEAGRGGKSAE